MYLKSSTPKLLKAHDSTYFLINNRQSVIFQKSCSLNCNFPKDKEVVTQQAFESVLCMCEDAIHPVKRRKEIDQSCESVVTEVLISKF